MKKIKFLFIVVSISLCFGSLTNYFCADEVKTEKEQTEEILKLIDDYIVQIDDELNEIDAKTKKTQEQKEFEYYPAIRLNIDTPFFGMSSVVDQKLRVKKEISTADVAKGYSIRDIVSKRTIRLPDTYLGVIVTSTKEYNIDDTLTLPQAKITLVKCIQYLSQVNSVNDYVDNQTNYIFKEYISEEKKANINDIKDRVKKVTNQLVNISDKIKKMDLMGIDVSEYKNTYVNLSTQVNEIKKQVSNTLILDNELAELKKTSLSNESDIITFETTIGTAYEKGLENLNYNTVLTKVSADYQSRITAMSDYITKASTTTKNADGSQTVKENYKLISSTTLDTLKTSLSDVNKEITTLQQNSASEQTNTSEQIEKAKTQEQLEQERQEKITKNEEKLDVIYNKYKENINKEYKFYIDNTNLLLKDSNDKLNQIYSYLDEDIQVDNSIFTYTKYIYIDLPTNLATYIEDNNMNSIIELNTLVQKLKTEISTLSSNNIKITTIYNKILKELSKS